MRHSLLCKGDGRKISRRGATQKKALLCLFLRRGQREKKTEK